MTSSTQGSIPGYPIVVNDFTILGRRKPAQSVLIQPWKSHECGVPRAGLVSVLFPEARADASFSVLDIYK